MKLFSLLIALTCTLIASSAAAASLRGSTEPLLRDSVDSAVLCRMILIHTLYEDDEDEDNFRREEETACAPIVNDVEMDKTITLDLPADIQTNHKAQLEEGILFVEVSNASVEGRDLVLSADSKISVASVDSERLRRLQAASVTQGRLSVAVVRISTSDSTNANSMEALNNMFDTSSTNFVTQYDKCSAGKLNFYKVNEQYGVVDVTVSGSVASFGTGPGALVEAAQIQLQHNLGLGSVEELADKIFMCLPSGTGNWVASAGLNHWRAQFNEEWCTSLTATMHEMGHSIGLLHSNKNFVAYADRTGYMAKGFRNTDWPLRCFNGQNNNHLGWYDDRKLYLDPLTSGPVTIDLAAFVDYGKTGVDQPVLVNLNDKLYLQYNRAKEFNAHTGEMEDQITVVTDPQDGGSQLLGGIVEGGSFHQSNFAMSGRSIYISACQRIDGNSGSPDIMTISIGMDQTPSCSVSNNGNGNNNGSGANTAFNDAFPTVPVITDPPPTDPVVTFPPPTDAAVTFPPPTDPVVTETPAYGRPPAPIPVFTDLGSQSPPAGDTQAPPTQGSPTGVAPTGGPASDLSVLDWINLWNTGSNQDP